MARLITVNDLPRFTKIKGILTQNTALNFIGHNEAGILRMFGNDAHQEFELEMAKTAKGLFSIRSCYSNKYMVLEGPDSIFLNMGAAEPNEDRSQWSCTLFEPLGEKLDQASSANPDGPTIQLRHVSSKKLACSCKPLAAGSSDWRFGLERDESKPITYETLPLNFLLVEFKPDSNSSHQGDAPQLNFPRYVALKCNFNSKYLCLHEDGWIIVDGDDVWSPNSVFELERADKELFTIRSCYNNKYWAKESPVSGLIRAVADQPSNGDEEKDEEEGYKYNTLFRPVIVSEGNPAEKVIQLLLGQSQELVAYSRFHSSLLALEGVTDKTTEFTLVGLEHFVKLPRLVAFKGDNGMYLAAHKINGRNYLGFHSSDIGDPEVAHEIFDIGDVSVGIKSKFLDKFWTVDETTRRIMADSDSYDKKDALFSPVRIGGNTVALRSVGNTLFCRRYSNEVEDCLSANISSMTKFTYITVEELVASRSIYNVNFRVKDARIYDETINTMVVREASNFNSEKETVELRLLYQQKTSSTWNAGLALSVGVEASFKAMVPFVAETEIKFSAKFEGSYTWGETKETTSEIETTHVVTVPPNSKVRVSLVATEGKCDVPFSYTIRDILVSGDEKIYEMDGGTYVGINTYNFRYETQQELLT